MEIGPQLQKLVISMGLLIVADEPESRWLPHKNYAASTKRNLNNERKTDGGKDLRWFAL